MRVPSPDQITAFLADTSRSKLEETARSAVQLTRQYFGSAISLYTPLYISNYCASHCTYCGFHSKNRIPRVKLSLDQIDTEMKAIAATGIRNVLLLTGESPDVTPPSWLAEVITLARTYFQGIALEVFPMSTEDYHLLYKAGADAVTIFQETYDHERYSAVHLAGQKTDYTYRFHAPERIATAGMRAISLGILLGLGPVADDLHALYSHLRSLEQSFPGVEYTLCFPRLRTVNTKEFAASLVDDITFTKILCLSRLLFPRVGINLSTRETAAFRNQALRLCVTRISAGAKTTVGGYQDDNSKGAPQFDIADERSVPEIVTYLKDNDFDPVFTDWRKIAHA